MRQNGHGKTIGGEVCRDISEDAVQLECGVDGKRLSSGMDLIMLIKGQNCKGQVPNQWQVKTEPRFSYDVMNLPVYVS